MPHSPIRVLLVEDSPIALAILKRMLASSPEIEVVGSAGTGREALRIISQVKPDVICTDLHMPQMNGLEFTAEVMSTYPRPILVVSASVQEDDTQKVFQLLEAGAVDVYPKPRAGLAADYEKAKQELISKIKILAGVTVFTQRRRKESILELKLLDVEAESKIQPSLSPAQKGWETKSKIVIIGASTGGPQALHTILTQLPSNFPVPIVCIQHISEGFLQGLVDWLSAECKLPVKIALAGESPQPGTVYFPAERLHLEFDAKGRFIYSVSPPVGGHRPSITVTFKSVANFYGRTAVAILLTGMGRDGADGMHTVSQVGGVTIAQDENSCVVFGMPKEAIALSAAQYILSISEIPSLLLRRIVARKT